MSQEKDELLRQMEARLSEARNQARKISGELIREGVETQKQILDAAREEAARLTKKAQEEIEASVNKAREALKRDVEVFSRKIIEKVLET
jgi:F-type H+-transporting ATPase subunit b